MRQTPRTPSYLWCAALGGALAVAGLATRAADLPAAPAVPAAGPATQGAQDAPEVAPTPLDGQAAAANPLALAQPFESLSAGISLRPPGGMKALREVDKDEIVRFQNADKTWTLVVTRKSVPQPELLTTGTDEKGRPRDGVLQQTVEAIRREHPGCQILRQNLTNLGNSDVGMIVLRYTKSGDKFAVKALAQHAIIQANDQLYYLVALTTPARKVEDDNVEDPGERQAAETFRAVLDSVKLLDRAKIRADQVDRLVRTRSLFTNLTERKLMSTLIPQQWRRVMVRTKSGTFQDIGYQYQVEEPTRKSGQDGLYVGIRTRVMPGGRDKPFPREDSAANFFTTIDRKHEDWSKLTAIDNGEAKGVGRHWDKVTEFGSSDLKSSRYLVADPKANPRDAFKKGEIGDPNQPWMETRDFYTLNVQYIGSKGDLDPVSRPLPPFYLPQALDTMLPRLLPPNEPKTYLVAGYVSDVREVMLRYLEVGNEQVVDLAGRRVRAVPITDHVTLEGAVTTHYVDTRGNWLGSENKATGVTIVPSDERTLTELWKDADLTRPEDMGQGPGGPAVKPNPTRPGTIDRTEQPLLAPRPADRGGDNGGGAAGLPEGVDVDRVLPRTPGTGRSGK